MVFSVKSFQSIIPSLWKHSIVDFFKERKQRLLNYVWFLTLIKRDVVPQEWQIGRFSLPLSRDYPITAYYVNGIRFQAELDTGSSRGDGNGFYISWLSLDLPRYSEFRLWGFGVRHNSLDKLIYEFLIPAQKSSLQATSTAIRAGRYARAFRYFYLTQAHCDKLTNVGLEAGVNKIAPTVGFVGLQA